MPLTPAGDQGGDIGEGVRGRAIPPGEAKYLGEPDRIEFFLVLPQPLEIIENARRGDRTIEPIRFHSGAKARFSSPQSGAMPRLNHR